MRWKSVDCALEDLEVPGSRNKDHLNDVWRFVNHLISRDDSGIELRMTKVNVPPDFAITPISRHPSLSL